MPPSAQTQYPLTTLSWGQQLLIILLINWLIPAFDFLPEKVQRAVTQSQNSFL